MQEEISHQKLFCCYETVTLGIKRQLIDVHPTLNKTLLLRQTTQNSKINLLNQVSLDNTVLWTAFISSSSQIDVIEQKYVVVADPSRSIVTIFELQTQLVFEIARPFQKKSTVFIMSFSESQLFCIVELYSQNKFASLTYYSYKDIKAITIPIHIENISRKDILFNCRQLNNHSKIGLSVASPCKNTFLVYQLKKDANRFQGKLTSIETPRFAKEYHCTLMKELHSNVYLLWALIGREKDYFILDATSPMPNVTKFVVKHKSIPLSLAGTQLISSVGSYLAFKGKQPQQNAVMVNANTNEVEFVHKLGKNEKLLYSTTAKLMNNRVLVEYSPDLPLIRFNEQPKVAFRLLDMLFTMKDGYLMLLLHLNQDFDDDLLLDCVSLLEQIE